MIQIIIRRTLAIGLALCLSLALMPLGCAGNQGVVADPPRGEGLSVPDATVSKFRACASQGRGRLKETSYAFRFLVEVTEDGRAGRVRLEDSSPGDGEMEACMARALEDMPVPPSVLYALSQQAEQAEAVSPQSRGAVSVLWSPLGAMANLVPVVVVIASVAVVVGVGVYLGKEAASRRRESKRKQACLDMYVTCRDEAPWACSDVKTKNHTICEDCRTWCKANQPYTYSECYECGFRDPP
jgi:hypothetical protein